MDNSLPLKQCHGVCKEWKPATTEFFVPLKKAKDGFVSRCRICTNAAWMESWQKRQLLREDRRNSSVSYQGKQKIILEDGTTQCSCCKQFKPATTEFFSPQSIVKIGLRSRCRQCEREQVFYPPPVTVPEFKTCSICHQVKPATADYFTPTNRSKDYLDPACRICVRAYRHEYVALHQEEFRERSRRYRKENSEYIRTLNRNRKALLRNIPGKHTVEDIQRMYEEQQGRCSYCRRALGKRYHVDHKLAITRGGSNDPANLVLACVPCNLSKGNKLLENWLKERELLAIGLRWRKQNKSTSRLGMNLSILSLPYLLYGLPLDTRVQ